jgi:type I restriction enzyme, S subunit
LAWRTEGHEVHEGEPEGSYELPEGWVWTTLIECAEVVTGTTPSKKEPRNYGNYMPFVKPPELRNRTLDQAEDNLSAEGAKLARILPSGSVLVSCIGNLGKTGINRIPVAFNQQINAVIFHKGIIPEYGFYYFQTSEFRDWLESVSSATTVSIVNKGKFQQAHLPLAPPQEQRRIVAKIEELLTALDAGVAGLKRIKAALKHYRAAVLKAACEGRLVPQDPNDEPAEQLLDRILAERRAKWEADLRAKGKDPKKAKYEEPAGPETEGPPELPEGWCWATVDQIGEVVTGTTPPKSIAAYYGPEFPFYKPTDLEQGFYTKSSSDSLSSIGARKARLLPIKSTLVTSIGATIGKTGFIRVVGASNQQINAIIPLQSILPEYVYFVCISPYFQKQVIGNASATTLPILNKTKFQGLHLPIPPRSEQNSIVAEIDRRLSVISQIEKTVETNLMRAGRMRQAILRRAFEGKLVGQETRGEPVGAAVLKIDG